MGRIVITGLQPLLDLPSCETQTTLDLILADASEIHVATSTLVAKTLNYTADLRVSKELKQTISSPPDRGQVTIQNVDKVFGGTVVAESVAKAEAVIGRLYRDPTGVLADKWVELFRGEAFPLDITETHIEVEILNDLAAAGYCVSDWSLAENCQLVYKHAGTCGSTSSETTCNKKRRSKHGCSVRGPSSGNNEHRFGGMEFPDVQTPSAPSGSGGDDIPPIEPPYCPRHDQYVLVRGMWEQPTPLRVSDLTPDHLLFHPIDEVFWKVKSASVIHNEPIFELVAQNGARSFSSHSHRVIPYRDHVTGLRAEAFFMGDPVLTWDGDLSDSRLAVARDTGIRDDVVKIEMEHGHIYCAGADIDAFIVAHNSKPLP